MPPSICVHFLIWLHSWGGCSSAGHLLIRRMVVKSIRMVGPRTAGGEILLWRWCERGGTQGVGSLLLLLQRGKACPLLLWCGKDFLLLLLRGGGIGNVEVMNRAWSVSLAWVREWANSKATERWCRWWFSQKMGPGWLIFQWDISRVKDDTAKTQY